MNITQVIIASIIFGIINSMTITWGVTYVKSMEERREQVMFSSLKDNIIDYYDLNGFLPNDLNDVYSDKNINTTFQAKDNYGYNYEYIKQNFTYGNVSDGVVFVSSKGANNILDSNISAGVLNPSEKETFFIISNSELNYGKRAKTKQNINICNAALFIYKTANPLETNVSIQQLVASNYMEGKYSYDFWGFPLVIESYNNCASYGPDNINNGANDVR